MGNRTKNRSTPRQARPVSPGQHELQIMRHIMEEAIATRVRVEDQARVLQAEHQQLQMVLAGVLLQLPSNQALLTDESLEALSRFVGFSIERDDETGDVTVALELADVDEDVDDEGEG